MEKGSIQMSGDLKYNIGLDIGTNSLGWAVADSEGTILTHKKRPMSGTVLIQDAGKTAAERRGFRSSRRRLARRRQRIKWLQDLMAPMFEKEDPQFFQRLKYSYVARGDETCEVDPGLLFDNSYYKTHEFHEAFHTIYHLRKSLTVIDAPMDPRLVYLAIHHIIKYRGNFLYEGQDISIRNLNLRDSIGAMIEAMDLQISEEDEDDLVSSIESAITNMHKRKAERRDDIAEMMMEYSPESVEKPRNWAKAIASLVMGYSADISVLFGTEEKKVSFADEKYIEAEDLLDDEQVFQFESIQKVYSGQVLSTILSGKVSTISDAYIALYDAHHKDLVVLKKVLKRHSSDETYDRIMNNRSKNSKSYAMYIDTTRKCSNKDLCDAIRKELLKMPQDDDVKYCLSRIEEEQFLLKPRNNNNGAIPNQLHCEELAEILDRQEKFHPYLSEIKDKILSIASFRIPYFVGPLNTGDDRHWVARTDDRIYPWNFKEVVDYSKTAERFIERLTSKCSYLTNENVLPKKSLLYSEYSVLAELSNVYVDNRHLSPECKVAAIEELFKTHKTVSVSLFRNWYRNKYMPGSKAAPFISGLSDNARFISNMGSYIDLSRILGPIDSDEKFREAEKVIEYVTIFNDREILEAKIRELLGKKASDRTVKDIIKLSYNGWGRLSRKLLEGLFTKDCNGFPVTIMDLLRTTDQNFMQILYDSGYGFEFLIAAENAKSTKQEGSSMKDIVMNYPGSPAIKKCTWVAVRVVEEIEKILGRSPSNIFIEVASGDEKKRRTVSRYKNLERTYSKIVDSDSFKKVYSELKTFSDHPKDLDRKAVALYFMQNGRCLYSGEPLDLSELSNYQIDHILPRCYIKDDSFDNLALVKAKANQRKLDSMVLEDSIIDSQRRMWEMLLKNGLISQRKFSNLCRRTVDEDSMEKFINRQLVETRQICTNVFNSLKAVYSGRINVYGVSAKLSYNLKNRIGVLKIRNLNDFHHAVDAYTALMAGMFAQKSLSIPKSETNSIYRRMLSEVGTEREARYGIIAELFCQTTSSWDGPKHQLDILNLSKRHDFYINCLVEEQTGVFYDQTIYRKTENPEKMIPRKSGMDPALYGGFKNENDAYYCIVRDKAKRGAKAYSMVGIPIRIVALQKQCNTAIMDYLTGIGIKDPEIVKDRIKKYQHILYSDNGRVDEFYIVGESEVINGKQLWLSDRSMHTLDKLLNATGRINEDDYLRISELYGELCERLQKYYPCFRGIGDACARYKADFMKLPNEEKVKHIMNMLIAAHANSKRVDKPNWKRVDANGENVEFNIPGSRLSKALRPEKITFVDSSITGMYTRRYKLGI